MNKPKAYRGVEGRDSSEGTERSEVEEEESRPGTTQQRMLRKAAGCSHSTDAESEGCPLHLDNGIRGGTFRPRIPPPSPLT